MHSVHSQKEVMHHECVWSVCACVARARVPLTCNRRKVEGAQHKYIEFKLEFVITILVEIKSYFSD